ncbi:MAG: SUMF1/EgtB/PvdO family nonheme iron enzyme [Chloroflexi bacterium]|nr:SUMF1/EgtB/PvdO family nonheme iron enzyme [Chloroflexota bacterium]
MTRPSDPPQPDPRFWRALLGRSLDYRAEAARTIRALEQDRAYTRWLLDALDTFPVTQRIFAGDALSLLGDPRFSPPHFLSEMLPVPSGVVSIGSSDYPNESPRHRVSVDDFALAQHPVTQQAYRVFVEATDHPIPNTWRRVFGRAGPADHELNAPVVFVSALDAEAYCRWLSAETGQAYRLPTEAEWIAAARGYDHRRIYPWGEGSTTQRANTWGRSAQRRLCAVGLYSAGRGPFQHDDLSGNVWEWCSSSYWPYPYRHDDGREGGFIGEPRVMHGGSWRSRPTSCRIDARQGEPPGDSFVVTGFRIARELE